MNKTRIEVADLLREMSHELVAYEFDDATLAKVKDTLLGAKDALVSGEGTPRDRQSEEFMNGAGRVPKAEVQNPQSGPFGHFTTSIVSGVENPMSFEVKLSTEGDRAIGTTTLGPAHEGAPGRAHGGIVAAILDEVMGMIPAMMDSVAFTGWLRVDYQEPCPLHVPLRFSAWCFGIESRKITVRGEGKVEGDETSFAVAEGLFIIPRQPTP